MSIEQLNAARNLVQSDPSQYPTLVRSVLPIGDRPEAEIRLWCAQFVSDFLTSETVNELDKNTFTVEVLHIMDTWLNDSVHGVVKLAVCILCEIYPRIYSQVVARGEEMSSSWQLLSQLKLRAITLWSPSTKESIVIACIKLAQVVVLTHQQPALNHVVLDHIYLTAEATALLDRLLSIFPSNESESFGVLSGSVNACMALAVSQPQLAPKIINNVLMFNLSARSFGTASQQALILRWINKLFKLALGPFARGYPQITKYLIGLNSYCTNQSLKRAAEDDHMPKSKRPKLNKDLPDGSQPFKALFSLVDNMMANFNARDLQFDLAVSIAAEGLRKVTPDDLEECLDVIKHRIATSEISRELKADTQAPDVPQNLAEEPANKETEPTAQPAAQPTAQPAADTQAINTNTADIPPPEIERGPSEAALEIEVPPQLTDFDNVFNRLLGTVSTKLISRLAARGLVNKSEAQELTLKKIYAQLVPDFRTCSEDIVLWLSEIYYAESAPREGYFELVSKVVDELIPKLEIQDSKTFIRLLSELPELNRDIVFKMRDMCIDPERSIVGSRTLKFLIMFKPPARNDCLDLVEELVNEGMTSLQSVLTKYRT